MTDTATVVPEPTEIPTEPAPQPAETAAPAPAQPAPAPPDLSGGMDLASLGLAPAQTTQATVHDDGIMEMGLDDESVKAYAFDLYQGRKGQTDRISIIEPGSIFGGRTHFKQGGGYFLCLSKFNKEGLMIEQAICCEKMDPPRKRFACLIVQYNTQPDGNLMNPFGFTLKMWRFTEDKYVQLRNIHKEFPLTQHDLQISCSEQKFQRLTIQNTKECIWRKPLPQLEPFRQQIKLWYDSNKPHLAKSIGRKRTPQEVLEILGLATAPAVAGSEMPLTDLASLLPTT